MFVEKFVSSKSTEFNLRRINKLLDEWKEVIQTNGDYSVDWNEFIGKLFMNELFY